MTRFGYGRRARAFALSLVTTALVLVLALAEWLIERFVAQEWRAAGTAIEIAVVLAAALVFRPVHQRVEAALESAIYRRRRQALAAVERFRHELTAFDDLADLLEHVVDVVGRYFENAACAIYLRRDGFQVAASSFDVASDALDADDPLIARFRSSGAPAHQRALNSAALGSHAFAMISAGELTGFIAVECKETDFDSEEVHALTVLARDLAVAAASLDPLLRPQKRIAPNNLPIDLPALIGRDNDFTGVNAALAQSRCVTITGAGGVGKTLLALQCAAMSMARYRDGVWLIDLAPVFDERAVAAAILSALDVATGGDTADEERLVQYLKPRDLLILLDNCEQVLHGVSAVAAAIRAACPNVAILATSREALHLPGEVVLRLSSLQSDAASQLFAERATAAAGVFDIGQHRDVVREICERLDGIPLAIELAAARARVLDVRDIAQRLHERFRLLSGGSPSALPRQQTLSSLIEWSYDLLSADEKSLFRRLGVFRGSFSLDAACAVCAGDGGCDDYQVLDVLTSLADKSLLTVSFGESTRYRFLESIREFAWQKAAECDDAGVAMQQHAAAFARLAARAYYEFDSKLPPSWLERLQPDIDNFRAALEYSLLGKGDRVVGAQLAADCGPVFLRLQLLGEGLRWTARARVVANLPPVTAARIEYVSSMMLNNLAQTPDALRCAQLAVDLYRATPDERGLVRALSQVAQQYARAGQYADALAPGEEAVTRARRLNEPRVLAAVLRRCAFSLPVERIDLMRAYFAEALDVARKASDLEETSLVLEWWASREAAHGNIARAIELSQEALDAAIDPSAVLPLEFSITGLTMTLGDIDRARPHAFRALQLSRDSEAELAKNLAILYCTPFYVATDAAHALQLYAFALDRLKASGWSADANDELALSNMLRHIRRHGAAATDDTVTAGSQFDYDRAIAMLLSVA